MELKELYEVLTEEDKKKVNRLIFSLWKKAGGSLNQPQLCPQKTKTNKEK